jgi:hypothetical protein
MEGPAALVQEFINGQSPRLTSQLHLSPCCLHGTRRCAHAPYSVHDNTRGASGSFADVSSRCGALFAGDCMR